MLCDGAMLIQTYSEALLNHGTTKGREKTQEGHGGSAQPPGQHGSRPTKGGLVVH